VTDKAPFEGCDILKFRNRRDEMIKPPMTKREQQENKQRKAVQAAEARQKRARDLARHFEQPLQQEITRLQNAKAGSPYKFSINRLPFDPKTFIDNEKDIKYYLRESLLNAGWREAMFSFDMNTGQLNCELHFDE